jgi:class 3 adenylate cyclase
MSRVDCICNRNIRIIAAYVNSKLGHCQGLFDGISYPADRCASPEEFFLNEDAWTTYDSYQTIFRRAREMVGEPYFYYYCGASSASLRSMGRLNYFIRVFNTPSDGYRKIPFFNKNLNDTKDIEIILPPTWQKLSGRMRTILRVRYHPDIDVQRDYIADPYRRGIIASIPTIWGLRPALVRQPLSPFDPEILFNEEPEFRVFNLNAEMRDGHLFIRDPSTGQEASVGKRVFLKPESINGHILFFGKYSEVENRGDSKRMEEETEGVLITETVKLDDRIIMKAGEILKAPYFILDVVYDQLSSWGRMKQVFQLRKNMDGSEIGLTEANDRLREEIREKNRAYESLEKTNLELIEAKTELENYNQNLKRIVGETTEELQKTKGELLNIDADVKARVTDEVRELEKYKELRRYLSPSFAEKILGSGGYLRSEPQRKMLTVLFSDIRNFSFFTDSLEPEELVYLLNVYLTEMTKLIYEFGGTLNKMLGDGLLVFFGDPIPMEDHAQRAVQMAIQMQRKVVELNREWLQYGHELGIGIGINTGYVTVGNIGSETHRDYTVIGNQVNVASRLESTAAAGQILISHRTYSRVKDLVEVEEGGKIQVKGIHTPIITYKVRIF